MLVDPTVLAAIEAALHQAPENQALRLHLAELYLGAKRPADALRESAQVLASRPDDLEALRVAAQAAAAVGDTTKEAAYQRLLGALTGPSAAGGLVAAEALQGLERDATVLPGANADNLLDPPLPIGLRVIDTDDLVSASEIERPRVTLADVGGMEAVKQRLNVSFLAPMRNPQLRAAFGKSLRGGLLLFGPPGCGKTFIARATAGELGARFIAVGISDVLDMWIGASERNLHETFEAARRNAPCVLFLDELDALGQKRTQQRGNSVMRGVSAQLLAELDGATYNNDGVFVLGATNHPWDVDSALKRPGRFDRSLLVLPPDEPARVAILEYHLRDRPLDTSLDTRAIARLTDTFSGADLALLCEGAAEAALDDSLRTGAVRPIQQGDLVAALRTIRPSTISWFQVARNFAMFANEGGVYDDLLAYIREKRLV